MIRSLKNLELLKETLEQFDEKRTYKKTSKLINNSTDSTFFYN